MPTFWRKPQVASFNSFVRAFLPVSFANFLLRKKYIAQLNKINSTNTKLYSKNSVNPYLQMIS